MPTSPELGSNPLASLTDVELWNAHLMLELACGRNHSALTRKRRQYYCLLAENLKIEAELRGVPHPAPPFGVGKIKPEHSGAL